MARGAILAISARGHGVEPEHPRGMCQLATRSALTLAAPARGAAVMSGVAPWPKCMDCILFSHLC